MNFEQFLEANISNKFSYIVQEDKKEEDKTDDKKVKDTICMNSSLFMRVLELVHEDVNDDEVLHHIVEKIIDLCNDSDEPLTMDSYDEIESLQKENSALRRKLNELLRERQEQRDNARVMEENLNNNVDVLRRISQLEREVYHKNKD